MKATEKDEEYKALLEKLKSKLCKVAGITDSKFENGVSFKRKYYTINKFDNLYDKIKYENMNKDIASVRSSAAMAYNLFGHIDNDIILDNKKYKIKDYELNLPAIKSKGKSPQLDVFIESEDYKELIYVETKMLEWLNSPRDLRVLYIDEKTKYLSDKYEDFIEYFKQLVDLSETITKKENNKYIEYYKHNIDTEPYDCIQMALHILGIYTNYEKKNIIKKKVRLINIVWDYNCDEYKKEELNGKKFVKKANEYFGSKNSIFDEIGIDFKVEYYGFSEFIKHMDFSNDLKRRKYLDRYLI